MFGKQDIGCIISIINKIFILDWKFSYWFLETCWKQLYEIVNYNKLPNMFNCFIIASNNIFGFIKKKEFNVNEVSKKIHNSRRWRFNINSLKGCNLHCSQISDLCSTKLILYDYSKFYETPLYTFGDNLNLMLDSPIYFVCDIVNTLSTNCDFFCNSTIVIFI